MKVVVCEVVLRFGGDFHEVGGFRGVGGYGLSREKVQN